MFMFMEGHSNSPNFMLKGQYVPPASYTYQVYRPNYHSKGFIQGHTQS